MRNGPVVDQITSELHLGNDSSFLMFVLLFDQTPISVLSAAHSVPNTFNLWFLLFRDSAFEHLSHRYRLRESTSVKIVGPFNTASGWQNREQNSMVFTCLFTRASHLKSGPALKLDSFCNTCAWSLPSVIIFVSRDPTYWTEVLGLVVRYRDNSRKQLAIHNRKFPFLKRDRSWIDHSGLRFGSDDTNSQQGPHRSWPSNLITLSSLIRN